MVKWPTLIYIPIFDCLVLLNRHADQWPVTSDRWPCLKYVQIWRKLDCQHKVHEDKKKPSQLSGGNLSYCRGLLGKFCKEPKTMLIYGKDSLAKFKRYCVLYFVIVTYTPAKYEFVTKFNSTKRTEHCNPCISIPSHTNISRSRVLMMKFFNFNHSLDSFHFPHASIPWSK